MNKVRKILLGYTLLELLIVMAIFMILGALGVGGYIGTRETMMARENSEIIKQDIRSVRLKAMLLERGSDSSWLYGIGIDFSELETTGNYRVFKWCSPFKDFGTPITMSPILNWNEGDPIPGARDAIPGENNNGYLPLTTTTSCRVGETSLVNITGYDSNQIYKIADSIEVLSEAKYVVFESLTGRAFLYNAEGKPVNYNGYGEYNDNNLLDIQIMRKRSSKFDLITIYPSSGTVIHHVYSNADKVSECTDNNCVTFDGKIYDRYDIADEINSYRD